MKEYGRARCEDIRLRLTPQERAELVALRAASGCGTMVEFLMFAARLGAPAPVDRSAVAALSGAVAALGAGPASLRALRAELVELRDQVARLPVGEERAAVLVAIREAVGRIDGAVERLESASEASRSVARSAMERIREDITAQEKECLEDGGRVGGGAKKGA